MSMDEFIFSNKRSYRVTRHLVFWIIYCIYFYIQNIDPDHADDLMRAWTYEKPLIIFCFFLPLCLFSVYAFLYLLLPFLLQKKKYLKFILVSILLCLINLCGYHVLLVVCYENIFEKGQYWSSVDKFWFDFKSLRLAIYISGVAVGIKLSKNWYLQQKENLALISQKTKTEIQLLKASIHPKFLFHSLNALYTKINSHAAESVDIILNLSDQLSYLLYDSRDELVPLKSELTLLHKLITLEKLKQNLSIKIAVNIIGDPSDKYIAPLILLPFIQSIFLTTYEDIDLDAIDLIITINGYNLCFELLVDRLTDKEINRCELNTVLKKMENKLNILYHKNHRLEVWQENNQDYVKLELLLSDGLQTNKDTLVLKAENNIYEFA